MCLLLVNNEEEEDVVCDASCFTLTVQPPVQHTVHLIGNPHVHCDRAISLKVLPCHSTVGMERKEVHGQE